MKPLRPDEEEVCTHLRRHLDIISGLIGQRNAYRPDALEGAARYIEKTMTDLGYTCQSQPYKIWGGKLTVRNIIAEVKGEKRPNQILILGAHYDSVDAPAANDNGSGVAGVLEIARLLAGIRFKRTLRFVFFVNEEPPFYKGRDMGSTVYAKACRERGDNIVGMVNLETIGCYYPGKGTQRYPQPFRRKPLKWILPNRGNFVVFTGDFASTRFLFKSWWRFKLFTRFKAIAFPSPRSIHGPDMSDHWSFWEADYPAIMVTDTAFFRYDHYHKATDTPDVITYPAMARVVQGLGKMIASLAGAK